MAKDTFDAIITSAPLNSTAARVTSRGESWEPKAPIPPNYPHWKAPPPMMAYSGPDHRRGATPNFIGQKFGRLTVLGILHPKAAGSGKNRSLRWVVKCACGDYEVRSSGALRGLAASNGTEGRNGDRCLPCMQLQIVHARYKRNGGRPITDFTGDR